MLICVCRGMRRYRISSCEEPRSNLARGTVDERMLILACSVCASHKVFCRSLATLSTGLYVPCSNTGRGLGYISLCNESCIECFTVLKITLSWGWVSCLLSRKLLGARECHLTVSNRCSLYNLAIIQSQWYGVRPQPPWCRSGS